MSMPPSPWSQVPRASGPTQAQQGPSPTRADMMAAQAHMQQPVTPDMMYPSFPNAAGLGSQVPFPDGDPIVIPVPADTIDQAQIMGQGQPQQPQMPPDPSMSPWGMMRG